MTGAVPLHLLICPDGMQWDEIWGSYFG